jgi:hypothetical protein
MPLGRRTRQSPRWGRLACALARVPGPPSRWYTSAMGGPPMPAAVPVKPDTAPASARSGWVGRNRSDVVLSTTANSTVIAMTAASRCADTRGQRRRRRPGSRESGPGTPTRGRKSPRAPLLSQGEKRKGAAGAIRIASGIRLGSRGAATGPAREATPKPTRAWTSAPSKSPIPRMTSAAIDICAGPLPS